MSTAAEPRLLAPDAKRADGGRMAPQRGASLLGDDVLASLLIRHQVAAERDVERCFEEALARRTFLEETAIASGLASAERMLELLEGHFFCPGVDLRREPPDPEAVALVPAALAVRHLVLPWRIEGDSIRLIMAQPDRVRLREVVSRACGRRIVPAVALRHDLWRAIEQAHAGASLDGPDAPPARALAPSRPSPRPTPPSAPAPAPAPSVVPGGGADRARDAAPRRTDATVEAQAALGGRDASTVVDAVLKMAVERGATDVHVEPAENDLGIRLRVDGILSQAMRLPQSLAGPMASRLKVLAGMDIAERRAPQDGRASFRIGEDLLDVRASSLPSKHGEKIVLRLLRRDASLLRAESLQMPPDVRARHREMIEAPMGLFLVTGPTGSGKTTTLYATLASIDREEQSVVTLEDPIEYQLAGITQVQIHEPAGLTFASGLKSILRQDPDVILVGEIREAETAEIACKAALTGHKVLSSLHSNDACQAVTRLADMGVARDLIAATLKGAIAQRLLRRPCAACRIERPTTELERSILGGSSIDSCAVGAGCAACGQTGYKGRLAVFEYLKLDDEIGRLVLDRASAGVLKAAARRAGMRTMLDAGRESVIAGETTIAEVQRVLLSADGSEECCPRCGRGVSPDFTSCPFCLHALRESCRGCGRAVHEGWRACPACGATREDPREAPHCGRCAAALEPGWNSCPYCLDVLR